MIAEFRTEMKEISADSFNPDNLTLAVLSLSEFKTSYEKLGLNPDLAEMKPFDFECDDDGYRFCVEKISTNVEKNIGNIIKFIIKQNLFVVIDADEDTKEQLYKTLGNNKSGYNLERLVSNLLYSLTNNDRKELEDIDYRISEFEESLLTGGEIGNINNEILKIKRKLLDLHSFYEQMSDVTDELIKNDNKIFNGKRLKSFKDYSLIMDKYAAKVDILRESLAQFREAYQANIDLKLNNTMSILTVIATIFLPLTLITSWYGMNFTHMPELAWKFGYVFVIGLCIVTAVVCIIIFKKKKWM